MAEMISLFKEKISETSPRLKTGTFKLWRLNNKYRKAIDTKRCQICRHLISKGHYKCALQGESRSEASDIRLSYVCNKFEVKT